MVADLMDYDVRDDLLEAVARALPLGEDRAAVERDALGQSTRLADALLMQRDALIESAELHRMAKTELARGMRVRHGLDQQNDLAEALAEGRGQALERPPGDRIDIRIRGHQAGEALGGSHAAGTRDGRYAR